MAKKASKKSAAKPKVSTKAKASATKSKTRSAKVKTTPSKTASGRAGATSTKAKSMAALPTSGQAQAKSTVKKYTLSPRGSGVSINEQDPKRRLGNFGGAGEHPRQGGRTSGIVGQTKQRNHTDRAKKK